MDILALGLASLGRLEDALAAIEEAVTVRRQLAAGRPDAFLPDLATALNILAEVLGALERSNEADVARAEAERIRAAST